MLIAMGNELMGPFLEFSGDTNCCAPRRGGGGLAARPNRHQVGGVSRSPDGLFAQQEREPIRGRPAVRGEKDIWWTARTVRGGTGHLGLTETQRGRLWMACG